MSERLSDRLTLTVPEAAELLGISRGSGYQAARTGELPTLRIGGRLLVPRQRLEDLLANGNDGEGKENGADPP
jgi:excisionase family DNA binding protein